MRFIRLTDVIFRGAAIIGLVLIGLLHLCSATGAPDADAEPLPPRPEPESSGQLLAPEHGGLQAGDDEADKDGGKDDQPNDNENGDIIYEPYSVVSENKERGKVPAFQLHKHKSLGIFAKGEPVTIISQVHYTPLKITFDLPSYAEAREIMKDLESLQKAFEKTKSFDLFTLRGLPVKTKNAVKKNVNLAIQKVQTMINAVHTTRDFILNGNKVTKLPDTFTEYCSVIVTMNTGQKIKEVAEQITSVRNYDPDVATTIELKKEALYEGLSDSQEAINMLERLLKYIEDINKALESLTNNKVDAFIGLLLQTNDCVKEGVEEDVQVHSCNVIESEFVCELLFVQRNKAEKGIQVIAVNYGTFISSYQNKYVRSADNPSTYTDISSCSREEGETIYRCNSLIWQSIECFTFALGKKIQPIIEACDFIRPDKDQLSLTAIKKGTLVDNIQQSSTVTIEGRYFLNETVAIIPYSFSFTYSTPEQGEQQVAARLPFDEAKPVRVTWLTQKQIEQITAHVDAKYKTSFIQFLQSDAYELFNFGYQIATLPFFIGLLYKLLKTKVLDRFELRKQRKKEKKNNAVVSNYSNYKKIANSRRERTRKNSRQEEHPLEDLSASAPR